MPKNLGITQIGETRVKAIIAGDFPTVTEAATVSGDTDLVTGSVVMQNADGTVSLITGAPADGAVDVDTGEPVGVKVYGVASESIPVGGAGIIWRTGQFARDNLTFGTGTWESWIPALPDTIFFQSANLAPNM